uniref:Uncharacterized protein n=1 Tax=Setaria italica TaxID=4555 RepID=K3YP08_SETIT
MRYGLFEKSTYAFKGGRMLVCYNEQTNALIILGLRTIFQG